MFDPCFFVSFDGTEGKAVVLLGKVLIGARM